MKAVLIHHDSRWLRLIRRAEKSCFRGRIGLLFTFAGIEPSDFFPDPGVSCPGIRKELPPAGGEAYLAFSRYLRCCNLLFNRDGLRSELEKDALFCRALLCYGGKEACLLPTGKTRLCFPDSAGDDLSLRRLLWEENRPEQALLRQLLDDLDENRPAEPQLREIIARAHFSGDEHWKEYFVTMPEILSSRRSNGAETADPMGEWVFQGKARYIRKNHPDDILLLSRTQVGSFSREYYSYALFLKANRLELPVYYHADYGESGDRYAWFADRDGKTVRIFYRNPDGHSWRYLALTEGNALPLKEGRLEEMLDFIRECL